MAASSSSRAVARVINYEVVHLLVLLLDQYSWQTRGISVHFKAITVYPANLVPRPHRASLPLRGLGTRLVPLIRINSTWNLQTLTNKTQITCCTCLDVMMSFPTLVGGLDFWRMDSNCDSQIILRNDISVNTITISILSLQMWLWPCTMRYMLNVDV